VYLVRDDNGAEFALKKARIRTLGAQCAHTR
jgi:hypothetical protein